MTETAALTKTVKVIETAAVTGDSGSDGGNSGSNDSDNDGRAAEMTVAVVTAIVVKAMTAMIN